jgi:hypothetical protein
MSSLLSVLEDEAAASSLSSSKNPTKKLFSHFNPEENKELIREAAFHPPIRPPPTGSSAIAFYHSILTFGQRELPCLQCREYRGS